ncbi:MAG: molybdopterin-dependent oxidoreductase, partial [Pseudolabrys sp.]
MCNICFWACAGQVHQRGGKPWKVTGHPDDEHSHGRLCTRGTAGLGSYVDPDRLVKPLMRVEQNGKQAFKPVSWDKALDFVAGKMKKIAKEHGPDRLALIAHGSGASLFGHLVRAYGSGSIAYPSFAQCRGPRDTGFFLTFGEGIASPEQTDMSNAECIVLVGSHIGENLHNGDAEYIQRHTIGFESLAKYIAPFTPEWAYTETGLDPEQIRRTAHVMAAAAPATMLHPGRHSTWYGDDTQRARAMAILAGLLGIWGRKGGYYLPEKVALPEYPTPAYPKPKSTWRDVTSARFPLAGQGVTGAIVGASVGADAHYKGWIVYGTNLPMTMPAAREQLKKAAQQLELFVAVDTMPAEITGYADVVLPECTYLERYDPLRNEDEREPSLALRAPAFKPLGESTPAWWMARELGLRLGLDKYFPWKDYKEVLDWQLKQVGSSLAEMEKLGMKKFPRKTPLYFPDDGAIKFKTANGKIQLYSELLAKYGFDALPRYTPPKQLPDGYLHLNYGR